MEIYSQYSVDSKESRENRKKNPVTKYYPMWDLNPGTSDFPALQATPVLVLHVLSV